MLVERAYYFNNSVSLSVSIHIMCVCKLHYQSLNTSKCIHSLNNNSLTVICNDIIHPTRKVVQIIVYISKIMVLIS